MEENDSYWDYRYEITGKPKEDKNSKNIVRKEAQEFFKSVCTYITQPKYNKDFIKAYTEKEIHKYLELFWKLYLKVR